MISWLRPPMSSTGGNNVPSVSSAAVTILGLRVTRTQVLRISALLTLRSLTALIDLPLDAGVQAYIWSFLFASIQTGVAIAAAASIFDVGGIAGRIAGSLLPPAADAAFISIFARFVLIAGPVVAAFESAVCVFEIMRLARAVEHSMLRAEAAGATAARPLVISASFITLLTSLAAVGAAWAADARPVAAFGLTSLVALTTTATAIADDGNIIEAACLALYAAVLCMIAVVEEAAVGAPFLGGEWKRQVERRGNMWSAWVTGEETAAVVLVVTVTVLLVSMSRAERFMRLLAYGHDAVTADEMRLAASAAASVADDDDENGDGADSGAENHIGEGVANGIGGGGELSGRAANGSGGKADRRRRRVSIMAGAGSGSPSRVGKTIVSTLTLLAATFRVLVWSRHIEDGEYWPFACRAWQVVVIIFLYLVFLRM